MRCFNGTRVARTPGHEAWPLALTILEHLEKIWQLPDEGLWEVRGGARQFTHSKVMAWVAFDRAVRSMERHGMEGPLERWRKVRDQIHNQVCEEGFDAKNGAFTQSYGSTTLDASALLIPLVGFLPASDPRVAIDGHCRPPNRRPRPRPCRP